jgi:hypothetical protein
MVKMGIESKALIYTYYIAGNREHFDKLSASQGTELKVMRVYSFLGKFCISFKCIPL